ncbi:MAG: ModD protein [Chlorobiaceae bacterium]|nr:ModD protein [Chlorobiaceae bacterium]NTW10542.1 ModD protein [Chlorobiaceae bacterium]
MFYLITDTDIERFIEEDVPFGDLTSTLLGIGGKPGEISFTSRENTLLCCTEEAAKVLEKSGARVIDSMKSGSSVGPGVTFLTATGPATSLHAGWKVALNLLEYASGIATRTAEIVSRAKAANPGISVVSTRKSFPGTKKIAIKAIMAGGAMPHRLGLSETILVFDKHRSFLDDGESFRDTLESLKKKSPEHKIIMEADSPEEALLFAEGGADIVQVDKMQPAMLSSLVEKIRKKHPGVAISAAGGINAENAALYAGTGIDIMVLSSVYSGKPSDIAVSLHPCKNGQIS